MSSNKATGGVTPKYNFTKCNQHLTGPCWTASSSIRNQSIFEVMGVKFRGFGFGQVQAPVSTTTKTKMIVEEKEDEVAKAKPKPKPKKKNQVVDLKKVCVILIEYTTTRKTMTTTTMMMTMII
jgi:hypothetical protein